MILSFAHALTSDLFHGIVSKDVRSFPATLRSVALRKLNALHVADQLGDMAIPPGNRLEALHGKLKGFHSIRINDQWRLVFRWEDGHAHQVQIVDYH